MHLVGLATADATTGLRETTLFFQDKRISHSPSNTATFYGITTLNGTLYFPSVPVIFNGNATGHGPPLFSDHRLAVGDRRQRDPDRPRRASRLIEGQPVLVE